MKTLSIGILALVGFFSLSFLMVDANAQVTQTPGEQYREYELTMRFNGSGYMKKVILQVNTSLHVERFGDPEIPGHGFFDYDVTGSVVEDGQSCKFEVLLAQDASKSTEEILNSKKDRSDELKLCSGLRITLDSVRVLMTDATASIKFYESNMLEPSGYGVLVSNGLKTVQKLIPSNPTRVLDRKDQF